MSFSTECGICYSYRLEDSIPDQVCNDPRCGQPFHQACLYEWLRGLPSSRQSFSVIFGDCPYCSKPITVKMAPQKS
ncbi:E3 ubiquitin-protein ligase FANCL [Takifugu flavidus]|uniref:E3 ubiquitin-protein ligase FANCL n=1 Tax=Takifugu flavidus TaxID=433684 RepID=A0A5C6PHU4_9TELE|nr:E3 ubiquitin-protein ligase FANCL [Takifugu flavidus]